MSCELHSAILQATKIVKENIEHYKRKKPPRGRIMYKNFFGLLEISFTIKGLETDTCTPDKPGSLVVAVVVLNFGVLGIGQ